MNEMEHQKEILDHMKKIVMNKTIKAFPFFLLACFGFLFIIEIANTFSTFNGVILVIFVSLCIALLFSCAIYIISINLMLSSMYYQQALIRDFTRIMTSFFKVKGEKKENG